MTTSKSSPGHDAPIIDKADDCLGRFAVARAIHRVIVNAPAGWSTRIGLYGRWGSGKTSVLNLLENIERDNGSIVVRFSAWSASGETGVIALFHDALRRTLGQHGISLPWTNRVKAATSPIMRWIRRVKWIGRGAEVAGQLPPGSTDVANQALSHAFEWLAVGPMDLQRLTQQLGGRRVVVFMDDLDRSDPKSLPKTLLALRELLDWPGFAFVLAFDKDIVANALGEYSKAYGDSADAFLEKIIDVPIHIPEPTAAQRNALARRSFDACCPFVPAEAFEFVRQWLPIEPRRVKLIARGIGVLRDVARRHESGEIEWKVILLHEVVAEASHAVAAFMVNISVRPSESEWSTLALDENERDAKLRALSEKVEALLGEAYPPSDRRRICDAVLAFVQRQQHRAPENTLYPLRLSTAEPCWTCREVQQLCADWHTKHSLSEIDYALTHAAQRGLASRKDAANELLLSLIDNYSMILEHAADIQLQGDHEEQLRKADNVLAFLECLWGQSAIPEIQESAQAVAPTLRLIGNTGRWVSWVRNPIEPALRARERRLALTAARQCVDKDAIYSSTDPFWERHMSTDAESAAIHKEWVEELRGELIEDIVEQLLSKFLIVDGLASSARGDDELGAWLLESAKSPLYREDLYAERLESVFRNLPNAAVRPTLADNARVFIEMLLFKTRNATWAGKDRLRELHATRPLIVPSAWRAMISVPSQFRMLSELRTLRKELIEAGVCEQTLPVPEWLEDRPRRLGLGNDSQGGGQAREPE